MADGTVLGNRLRARRTELGLTLAEVAERASLSLPYVSNLERGRGNPTYDALHAIARALEVSLSTLVPEGDQTDPIDLVLAQAPASLTRFARSQRFGIAVEEMAAENGQSPKEVRSRLLVAMASAPRRSVGEPTDDDWKRLLDVFSLIVRDTD